MDKKQFAIFCSAIKTYYPREKIIPNEQAMELWYMELGDLPYEVAQLVLRKWVATNKWSPTIADIREQATEIIKGKIPDWGEAWEQVRLAVREYGSYNPQDALDSLDELTREAVKRIGYSELCRSDNPEATRANFRMIYEELAKKKKLQSVLPKELSLAIETTTTKLLEARNDT